LRTVEPQLDVHREGGRITLTASAYAHAVGHDDEGGRLWSDNWFDLLPGLPKTLVYFVAGPEALRLRYSGPTGWAERRFGLGEAPAPSSERRPVMPETLASRVTGHACEGRGATEV
jgi:hypothetical protein